MLREGRKQGSMEREIDLKEVSDGKLYGANDMVKIGCNDCAGCSACCRTVGNTIFLDPYDMYQLKLAANKDFEELLQDRIELQVVDGLIQPNLKMREDGGGCTFLSEEGRCTIHAYRPGFCRMFPMGRIYQEGGFRYFLQVHECGYPNKTKLKLKKWLGIPELPRYEAYINRWHDLLVRAKKIVRETENQEIVKNLNLYLLNEFYVSAYETGNGAEDFYEQFERRLAEAGEKLRMYG